MTSYPIVRAPDAVWESIQSTIATRVSTKQRSGLFSMTVVYKKVSVSLGVMATLVILLAVFQQSTYYPGALVAIQDPIVEEYHSIVGEEVIAPTITTETSAVVVAQVGVTDTEVDAVLDETNALLASIDQDLSDLESI